MRFGDCFKRDANLLHKRLKKMKPLICVRAKAFCEAPRVGQNLLLGSAELGGPLGAVQSSV